jgi:hypothetical protein
VGTVRLEFCRGTEGRRTYSMKREEFMADFCLVSRRALDDIEYRIFRYHYLLGADWRLCCRQLKMERGDFFHQMYRIEAKLGRVFAELAPYPLYPLREYFNGVVMNEPTRIEAARLGSRSAVVPRKPVFSVPTRVPLPLSA